MLPLEAQKEVLSACSTRAMTKFHAAIIYSQGLQESGYDSHVFVTDNNAYGMKMPHKRISKYIIRRGLPAPTDESFAGDPYNYYAHYADLTGAVLDLLDRHAELGLDWNTINTVDDYIQFCIKTRYFQGSPSIYESNVAHFLANN